MSFHEWVRIHRLSQVEDDLRMGQRFYNEFCKNDNAFPGLYNAAESDAAGIIESLLRQWHYWPNMPTAAR
jgi:hypothetical protein